MGGSCASRIDFPGAEFNCEAAAASGDRGVPKSGAELDSGSHAGAGYISSPLPRWASPGIYNSGPGLRDLSPSFPRRHTSELKTESEALWPEVAETREGGWAPLGVPARPMTLRHRQAGLRDEGQGPRPTLPSRSHACSPEGQGYGNTQL